MGLKNSEGNYYYISSYGQFFVTQYNESKIDSNQSIKILNKNWFFRSLT